MKTPAPPTQPDRRRRLMRTGYATAGSGLCAAIASLALLTGSLTWPPVATAALICVAAALVMAGFAQMVIAADPFADEELDDTAG